MRFSILIPVYNVEKYLQDCLDSLYGQTFQDFEIILIDDGSTDSSSKICDWNSGNHSNCRVLHKENGGLLSARRDAFAMAVGEYCVCLDSDDALRSDALMKINRVLESNDVDVVMFGQSRTEDFSDRWDKSGLAEGMLSGSSYRRAVASGKANNLASKAIKRELISGGRIDYGSLAGLTFAEDWLQVADIACGVRGAYFLDCPLYYYRPNESSSTSSYKRKNYEQLTMVLEHIATMAKDWEEGCCELLGDAVVRHVYRQMSAARIAYTNLSRFVEELEAMGSVFPSSLESIRCPLGLKNRVMNMAISAMLSGKYKSSAWLIRLCSKS